MGAVAAELGRWTVPNCDALGRHKASVVTVNPQGEVVLLAPPPGSLVVDPEVGFDQLITALNHARSAARCDRERQNIGNDHDAG